MDLRVGGVDGPHRIKENLPALDVGADSHRQRINVDVLVGNTGGLGGLHHFVDNGYPRFCGFWNFLPVHRQGNYLTTMFGHQGQDTEPTEDSSQMVTALKRVVGDEYVRDQVTLLQGWVVSLTEARLYALAAMYYGG